MGGAVSRLVKTLGGKREKVLMGYEQVGTMDLETVYTEWNWATANRDATRWKS